VRRAILLVYRNLNTIEKAGAAEQTINKSRFYAHAAHCESEQHVGAFLRAIAAQHASAHHLAYAFRIKTPEGIIPRFSDAGEPSGTAGKPVLQMLEGQNLINVCVGVIRYYGGINLGTEAATILPFVEMQLLKLTIQYNRMDELTRTLAQLKGKILDKKFDDAVHVEISLPALEANTFLSRFN
jgi:putative IMPACT (imprinted ancient) family translation regulator